MNINSKNVNKNIYIYTYVYVHVYIQNTVDTDTFQRSLIRSLPSAHDWPFLFARALGLDSVFALKIL